MMSEPLASRLRPTNLDTFVGQTHLFAKNSPLRRTIESGKLHSMIFWGPPGTGKTTLGQLIANYSHADFIKLSAVMAGVKEIREAVALAQHNKNISKQDTIVFIDEIHRFNKSQQDALLPFVEDGTIYLIGATTENPSFEVNNALLSRCRVYALKSLSSAELSQILSQALLQLDTRLDESLKQDLVLAADGDARRLLNLLEIVLQHLPELNDPVTAKQILADILKQDVRQFDKKGELFYEQISALHKSVRGSSPDGALYWLCRMLDGGCDPFYIARRVIRMASEDIGNADPRALTLALDAWNSLERLGYAEGQLMLAQAVVYMAVAAKSNAVYVAFNTAMDEVKQSSSYSVPIHLRNAPTKLMKKMGYGKMYRYDHDEPDAFAKGQTYFPDELGEKEYYHPTTRGLEIKIKEKLDALRKNK